MDGEKKKKAAKNMINGLYEYGYIDNREKETLEYRLRVGDMAVFKELRAFLIKVADEIIK